MKLKELLSSWKRNRTTIQTVPDTSAKPKETNNFHPVYCRLVGIAGLDKEKHRCDAILKKFNFDGRVIAIVRVSGDWLFGQCNFKADQEDGFDLKFLDTIQTIVGRDLEMFAAGGVSKLIFVEKDLFESFEATRDRDFETFAIDSVLVEE